MKRRTLTASRWQAACRLPPSPPVQVRLGALGLLPPAACFVQQGEL